MKKINMALFLAIALFVNFAFASLKIGFVDVRKAVESTSAGKKVKSKLEAEFKKREKTLKKQAEGIQKMTEDFEKKRAVLSNKARAEKQQSIQEEMLKYNQDVTRNTSDIRKKEQELMKPVFEKMEKVINNIAKKEKYTLILQSRDNVLFAKKEIDLTDKVVKAFEKK